MTIFYIILSIIALILIVAALLPKTFELKAEAIIHKPKQQVRDYAKLFKHQVNYSVRVMADPQVKLSYHGTDGTVGTRQTRDSTDKNVGK
jgi:hypothetical protein